MQGNTAQKTGLLSLVLAAVTLTPSIADSSFHASIPHQAATMEIVKAVATSPLIASVDHPDILPMHKQIAHETLVHLGTSCLSTLQTLYVRYEKPKSRGLASKSSIILDGTVSHQEFRALLIHEFGHVVDLGCFTGTKSTGPSTFRDGTESIFADDPSVDFYTISWLNDEQRRGDAQRDHFVSGYAASDPFEDFSETFAYFMLQRNTFRARASANSILAKKYNWMRDHFDGLTHVTGQHQWDGTVPWDVTKLPYIWHKQTIATAEHDKL